MRKRFLSIGLALLVSVSGSLTVFADSEKETVINQAYLEPVEPRSPDLAIYLDEVMADLINDEMSTYEQVKACYDYLVDTVSYGSHTSVMGTLVNNSVSCRSIYSNYGEVEGYGAAVLTAKKGMCNAYASGFILMAREIGLDAYLVKGSTKGAGGGYVYHEWAEVLIDGTPYIFDPQLEQNLVSSGLAPYTVFCVTYDQVPGRYSLA